MPVWLASLPTASTVQVLLTWFTSSFAVIGSSIASPGVTSTTPVLTTASGVAPANAAWASVIVQAEGTPASGITFYAAGGQASGNVLPSVGFNQWTFEDNASGKVLLPWQAVSGVNTSQASNVELLPTQDSPVAITGAISGILESAVAMNTTDSDQMLPSLLGAMLLNTGASTKMTSILTSPFGSQGAALILAAENDGGTDTAWAMIGTITTPDDETIIFTPVAWFYPYGQVLYASGSSIVIVTKTSGSGTITGLPATVKAEAWGAGASLSGVSGGASALGGCGSGGYSQEPVLATAGSVSYSVPASANALGGAPPDCTIAGSAVTVTAHSGFGGTITGFGNGAAASSNTVAYPGARGGNPSFADPGGGGGGASSAGPNNAGQHGDAASPKAGGQAGQAVPGGGAGGQGGNPSQNASAGLPPGGGAGGGGTNADGRMGGAGQVRVTYADREHLQFWLLVSSAATTDPFGTAIPAGACFRQ